MTYTLVDEKALLVQLLRALLPGTHVTATPQQSDPLPCIVLTSSSMPDTHSAAVQSWRITLMTAGTTRRASWQAAVAAHMAMDGMNDDVTGIPGLGYVFETDAQGSKPQQYAGAGALYQHICTYVVRLQPDPA